MTECGFECVFVCVTGGWTGREGETLISPASWGLICCPQLEDPCDLAECLYLLLITSFLFTSENEHLFCFKKSPTWQEGKYQVPVTFLKEIILIFIKENETWWGMDRVIGMLPLYSLALNYFIYFIAHFSPSIDFFCSICNPVKSLSGISFWELMCEL